MTKLELIVKFSSQEIETITKYDQKTRKIQFIRSTDKHEIGKKKYSPLLREKLNKLSKVNARFVVKQSFKRNKTKVATCYVKCVAHRTSMPVCYWRSELKQGQGIEMIWGLRCLECCGLQFIDDGREGSTEEDYRSSAESPENEENELPDDRDDGTDYGESSVESNFRNVAESQEGEESPVTSENEEGTENDVGHVENSQRESTASSQNHLSSIADDYNSAVIDNLNREDQVDEVSLDGVPEINAEESYQQEFQFDGIDVDVQEAIIELEPPELDFVNENTNDANEILVNKQLLININSQITEALTVLSLLRN